MGGHSEALQPLEVTYLGYLAFAALPMLVMGAVNGFFSGRGQTWIVLGIEGIGTAVNVIFGAGADFWSARASPRWGSPEPGWRR